MNYTSKLLTTEQDAYLRKYASTQSRNELAENLNKRFSLSLTPNQIHAYKKNHKIKGRGSQAEHFRKGVPPTHKGQKWSDYMSEEKQAKSRLTCFKKGIIPHCHKPIGTEVNRLYSGTNPTLYWRVKIAEPNVWKFKHELIWEQANGKRPPGMAIIFADNDTNNCKLENLLLVSRAELLQMNQRNLIRKNAELTKTGILISKLILETAKAKKRKK